MAAPTRPKNINPFMARLLTRPPPLSRVGCGRFQLGERIKKLSGIRPHLLEPKRANLLAVAKAETVKRRQSRERRDRAPYRVARGIARADPSPCRDRSPEAARPQPSRYRARDRAQGGRHRGSAR